jgi:hypothetical protein
MFNIIVIAGATSCYSSGSNQMMRLWFRNTVLKKSKQNGKKNYI